MQEIIAKIVFYSVSILEFVTYVPQIIQLLKTKSSQDISITSQIVLLLMNGLWLVYWILTDLPTMQFIFCIVIFIEVTMQVALVFLYRRTKYSACKES